MELDALRALVTSSADGLSAKAANTPTTLDRAALATHGLSNREIDELLAKLSPRAVPDFTLDPSRGKPGEHFAERFAAAVPQVDKAPPGDG